MSPREMEFVDGTTQMEIPRVNKSSLLWRVTFCTVGKPNKKHVWDHLAPSDLHALARCMKMHPDLDFPSATVKLWRRVI